MRTEPELLNERLDRLATVLDEIMPNCALLVRDALELLKDQETEDTGSCRVFQCKKCGFGIDDIFVNDEEKYQILPRYCPNCGRLVK